MARFLRSFLRLVLPGTLFVFYGLIALCFLNRWDQFVAITTIPIWVWAGIGALIPAIAWPLLKGRLILFALIVWICTGIAWADETRSLLRGLASQFESDPETKEDLRLVTIHCGGSPETIADQIKKLKPGIVFLQNLPTDDGLPELADQCFGIEGEYVYSDQCAIVAAGEFLNTPSDDLPYGLTTTLRTSGGEQVDLINIQLQRMPLRFEFWEPAVTEELMAIRKANRKALRSLLNQHGKFKQPKATLVGGSFGAPPSDDIYRLLRREGFDDSFLESGTGWGNTFSSRHPIIRIDQIWSSRQLKAIRSFTVPNQHSNHWMVVSDFALNRPTDLIANQ